MVRIEVFVSASANPVPAHAAVALIQAIDSSIDPKTGLRTRSVGANMVFYAATVEQARGDAERWLAAEIQKERDLAINAEKRASARASARARPPIGEPA